MEEQDKSQWQKTKESWYDKIPLTVRQLDIIIWVSAAALVALFVKAFLESGLF